MAKARENNPAEAPRPERWSAKQKTEIILRLLRGDDLGELSRQTQVPAHELEEWRRVFLEGGTYGLRRRGGDPTEKELNRTRAKLGQTMMKLELIEDLLEKRGYGDEVRKLLKPGRG